MKKILLFTTFCIALLVVLSIGVFANQYFADVNSGVWFEDGANYVFETGYMTGVSDGQFAPNTSLTRAMVVQVLANISGDNVSAYSTKNSFNDVGASSWYHNAVEWAKDKSIAGGTGDGKFSPNLPISRQDLSLILYGFANKYGCHSLKAAKNISSYSDYSSISEYAKNSMAYAVGNGWISGTTTTTLSPRSTATRAQFACILKAYDNGVGHRYSVTKIKTRTCTVDGQTKYTCLDCSRSFISTTKAWHVYKDTIQKAATCGSAGSVLHKCQTCSYSYITSIAATGAHSWNSGKITKTATKSVNGIRTYTCTKCGTTKTEAIAPYYSNGAWYVKYKDTNILIANKTYALSSSYNPGGLTSATQNAFNKLVADAKKAGYSIWCASGFRSYSKQESVYNKWVNVYGKAEADRISARPGHSEHQTGLAIDVNQLDETFGDTATGKWLAKHAHEYGFIIRYTKAGEPYTGYSYEPWHIRYLGSVAVATEVYNSGLTLEQFLGIDSKY